jgi:hypothetical protein
MNHKDYKTINLWLKDLKEKQYIEWIYSTHFAEKTKPAIYYLGINGIRYLKSFNDEAIDYIAYPIEELRKRYRDSTRSQTYIDRCILLTDCCISLEQARDEENFPNSWYFYETEADYLGDSFYHFMADSELIRPLLCFSKEQYEGGGDTDTVDSYLLEVFDATMPRYRIKKRLSNYVEYLDDCDEWRDGADTDKLPIILLVCPRTSDLIFAKRRTRGLMAEIWEYDDRDRPHIRFTTTEKLKEKGVSAQEIWENA